MKALAQTMPYSVDMASSTIAFHSFCVLAETPAQASSRCHDGMGQGRDADVCQGHVKKKDGNLVPVVLSMHFLAVNFPVLVKRCIDGTGAGCGLTYGLSQRTRAINLS